MEEYSGYAVGARIQESDWLGRKWAKGLRAVAGPDIRPSRDGHSLVQGLWPAEHWTLNQA